MGHVQTYLEASFAHAIPDIGLILLMQCAWMQTNVLKVPDCAGPVNVKTLKEDFSVFVQKAICCCQAGVSIIYLCLLHSLMFYLSMRDIQPYVDECADMRKEMCFMEFNKSTLTCAQPMSNKQTKMLCCCSMGNTYLTLLLNNLQ